MIIEYTDKALKQLEKIVRGDKQSANLKLKDAAEDKSDYLETIEAEMKTKKWHSHDDIKKKFRL